MAEELAESVIELGGKSRNIIHDDDALAMRDLLTEKNLAQISHSLPLLIVKNQYYVGYEEISTMVEGLEKNQ
ncbi:MAG: hypothetical protein JEY91_07705 [Spirochaetaceae bacterium]|nr:hypothetical protein [Spirochaetaceae bacterium]